MTTMQQEPLLPKDDDERSDGGLDLPQDETANWSRARRVATVTVSIFGCLFLTGLVFGFAAILPNFEKEGLFHDECDGTGSVCKAQVLSLTLLFTLASSGVNIAALPTGAILDAIGPKWNATLSSFMVALGCLAFSFGGPGEAHRWYYGGFLLMACFGPPVFVSTLSVANLFPGREGLITAALVGCFDASSAVFIWLGALNDYGISISDLFFGFAAVPLVIMAVGLMLWPFSPVSARGGGGGDDPEATGPPAPPMNYADCPMSQQVKTGTFWLLVQTVSVNMIVINFYIATVNDQVKDVDPENGHALAKVFAVMLPLGGIVWIPLIGAVTDNMGPHGGYGILWVLLVAYQGLAMLHRQTGASLFAYAAFTVFSICRPLFYTVTAAFTGLLFGFETFGKLYGLIFTLSGIANMSVQPLRESAEAHGFQMPNGILFCLQLSTCLLILSTGAPSAIRHVLCPSRASTQKRARRVSLNTPDLQSALARSPATPLGRRQVLSETSEL